ncbi:MAG: hypothetical protein N5P05_002059 [Chroococcopsis gigantea SAG 12.99]|jgi:hypothetical protein|nr:hypothetical protein [Chlorogloea purpurea SAG 13.99]MDV3000453.1 hypothetical protein [Chroococcopsis gigantea SAG 12.99]
MQISHQAPRSITLSNHAPGYRVWLGAFLATFPIILAIYSVFSQRRFVKCDRSHSVLNCNYTRPNDLPSFDSETISLDNLKKTAVYEEIYILAREEKIVNYYVLALADNRYVYIDNFPDVESALAFKNQIEAYRLKLQESSLIEQSYRDSLALLAKNPKYYHFYLWTILALIAGAILIYDAGYSQVYTVNDRTQTLSCQTRIFRLCREKDYVLERIQRAFIKPEKDIFGVTYHRITLVLTNGETLTLNRRLIEAMSRGRLEKEILKLVESHLDHLGGKVLVS